MGSKTQTVDWRGNVETEDKGECIVVSVSDASETLKLQLQAQQDEYNERLVQAQQKKKDDETAAIENVLRKRGLIE